MSATEPRPGVESPSISDPATPGPQGRGPALLARFNRDDGDGGFTAKYSLVGVWIALTLFYIAVQSDVFLTSGTFKTIFGSQQAYVFLGMAAVITFAVGEFDFSIAANMALAAILVPVLVVNEGWSPAAACVVAVVLCMVVGAINAAIVVGLGIDAIITTLGVSTLLTGLTSKISGGQSISGLSEDFGKIANTEVLLGLPISFYYGLVLTLGVAYVMRFTPLGRHMAFVGANREVARLAGVRVVRIRAGAYITSGLFCGLGGVVLVAGLGGFDSSTSFGYLLPALAATFLGTAAIRPGRFNALGTFVAIYFLVTGIVGLQLLGASTWVNDVFYGGALIVAVVISTLARRRTLGA